MVRTITMGFPPGTKVTRPRGGYLLWVELPQPLRSRDLFERALAQGICFVPGENFSASGRYGNCLRLSCGHAWNPLTEQALMKLADMVRGLLGREAMSERLPATPHSPARRTADQ
jgi:DNA-binding transcriptional MocR family regulator